MAERERWLVWGAGSFGTAIGTILARQNLEVTLATRTRAQAEEIRETRTNPRYFPDVAIPRALNVIALDDLPDDEHWDVIVLAVPTRVVEETLPRVRGRANAYISLAKGLLADGRRISEYAAEVLPPESFVALSGPNIAWELMHGMPAAAVIAGIDEETVARVQRAASSTTFRLYASTDLVGVEFAGSTKNVIAIAAGFSEAAGFGTNSLAALITRGLGEMARFGMAHGARLETYLGLAGVGDLITTCMSEHSRNHRAGRLLAEGCSAAEARERIGQSVEGLRTAPIVWNIAQSAGIEMHVSEAVASIAAGDAELVDVLRTLMSRRPAVEFEFPAPLR